MAWTEPRLLGTTTVQQAWWNEREELEAGLLVAGLPVAGLLVAERYGLVTTQLNSLVPSIEDSGMDPADAVRSGVHIRAHTLFGHLEYD